MLETTEKQTKTEGPSHQSRFVNVYKTSVLAVEMTLKSKYTGRKEEN